MANELKRSKRIVTKNDFEKTINPENIRLLDKYIMDMEIRELSVKSIYNYKRDLLHWLSYVNEHQYNIDLKTLTEDDCEEFIYYCKQNGNNTERIKRRISSISAFYIFLRKKKLIKENPLEFISRPKKGLPVVIQTFLSHEQYNDMKVKLSKYTKKENNNCQLELYALLSIDTMARVNAMSSIRWEQIDFNNNAIDEVLEKEGYLVTLYFSDENSKLLKQLKKYRKDNNINDKGYVFGGITTSGLNMWCKKIGKMINIETLHPHDFRHSGSQLLKLKGMPIENISSLLNHKGLDVTKNHYLRDDKKQMREMKNKYKI